MVKLVNDKQKSNSNQKETIKEEEVEETIDDDEELVLQNYKSDL
jgi:hypothetical protein